MELGAVTTLSVVEWKEGTIDINDDSMDNILEPQEVVPAVEIVVDVPSSANLNAAESPAKQQDINM